MIIMDVDQGSDEWLAARLGIPTASMFKNIITSQGKPSTRANDYMHKLCAELLLGKQEDYKSEAMERGSELESEARTFYEFQSDLEVQQVGIVYLDEEKQVACSPDGFIGDDKGLEIKCPKSHTHVKYLLAGKVPAEYVPQVQGSMWITERSSWDFLSYYPGIAPLLITVERDDEYIDLMAAEVNKFIEKLTIAKRKLNIGD